MSNFGFSPSRLSPAAGALSRSMSPPSKDLLIRLRTLAEGDLMEVAGRVGSKRWSAQDPMNVASDEQRWDEFHDAIDALSPVLAEPPMSIVDALVADHFEQEAPRPRTVDPIEDPDLDLPEPSADRFVVARRSDAVALDDADAMLLAAARDLVDSADFMSLGEAIAVLVKTGVHRRLGYEDERSAVASFISAEVGTQAR